MRSIKFPCDRGSRLALTGVLLVSLAACATDAGRTRVEGTAVGAGAGAAVGAIIGAIAGNPERGAAIGAGVGGLLGLGIGNEIAARKAEYANAEAFYAAETDMARTKNRELAQQNSALERGIAQQQREVRTLQADVQAGRRSRDALVEKEKELAAQERRAKQELAEAEEQLTWQTALLQDAQANGASPERIEQLEREVRLAQSNAEALQQGVTAIGQTRSSVL